MRRFVIAAIAAIQLAGCATSETLFKSNFDPTPVGAPPAHAQAAGTANVFGPGGSVTVTTVPDLPGKWVQVISQSPADVSGMQCNFSQKRGDGTYTFTATLVVPAGTDGVSIQFESFNQPLSSIARFFHIDFVVNSMMQDRVRIDDLPGTEFGTFPRNQPFLVQVKLTILATTTTAHIVLSGAGASGARDYTIQSPFLPMTHDFGAVRMWMGFPSTGKFHATNIVVTRLVE